MSDAERPREPERTIPWIVPAIVPVYRILALEIALIALLIAALGFRYDGGDINLIAAMLAAAIGLAILLRRRGLVRVPAMIEGSALILASSMAIACLSFLLATLSMPYQDSTLATVDRWLVPFLSWPDMVRAIAPHTLLIETMSWIYTSFLWQPFLLIALLAATGREPMVWRFLHAWFLTLAICVVIFAFAPATTAFVHYGFVHADIPALSVDAGWRPAAIIADIRAGGATEISSSSMAGLITFPSFHAAGATLLAWGFRRVRLIGGAFVALNAGVILCTPLIGSHYFVDVFGGIGVALIAIAATRSPGRIPARGGAAPEAKPAAPSADFGSALPGVISGQGA